MDSGRVSSAICEAKAAAAEATNSFLASHGGGDLRDKSSLLAYAQRFECGFAWVTVYEKATTQMGRELCKNGFFSPRWSCRRGILHWCFPLWPLVVALHSTRNPSGGSPTQAITDEREIKDSYLSCAKEHGAEAATRVLTERLGVRAFAGASFR
jgi:hypothetical protein